MFTGEQNHGGEAAIGRVPVVSASGEQLMTCKPAKVRKLLMAGKAFKKRMEDGAFYIKLRFTSTSTIVRPLTGSVQESE